MGVPVFSDEELASKLAAGPASPSRVPKFLRLCADVTRIPTILRLIDDADQRTAWATLLDIELS